MKVGCAVRRRRVQEGESPGSVLLAGVVGIQFAACIQEPGVADSPVLFEEADGRAERASATGCPVPLHGTRAPKGAIGTITVQGVFHRLMVREGIAGALVEEMASFACAAGLREGRWDGLRR